jgi:hypothetical protein
MTIALIFANFLLPGVFAADSPAAALDTVETKYGRTDVKLIKVRGLNLISQERINLMLQKEVARFAESKQAEFITSSITSQATYNANDFLSVTLTEYSYSEGAAHPMTILRAFTFNTKTGDHYELRPLFKKGSDFQSRINELIKNDLAQRDNRYFLEPFTGIDENQEFYLKDNSLIIYYQTYRYTAYAAGILEFAIPFSQLSDILIIDFI